MFFRLRTPMVLALLAIVAAAPACRQSPPDAPRTATPQAAPVVVATATEKPVDVSAIGNVLPVSSVTVHSRVTGVLERVHFAEGQDVKVGDVLFSLDRGPSLRSCGARKRRPPPAPPRRPMPPGRRSAPKAPRARKRPGTAGALVDGPSR